MLFYHVTDRSYVKDIMQHGFMGRRNSFTRKQDVRLYLRHPTFREFVRRPVVLEVEVPKKAIVKTVLDRLFEEKAAKETITRPFRPVSVRIIHQKKL